MLDKTDIVTDTYIHTLANNQQAYLLVSQTHQPTTYIKIDQTNHLYQNRPNHQILPANQTKKTNDQRSHPFLQCYREEAYQGLWGLYACENR